MKRGQINSTIIVFILSIIIIAIVVIFGNMVIKGMLESSHQAQIIKFNKKLAESVEISKSSFGSVKKYSITIPSKTTKVCMADLAGDPDFNDMPYAEQSYSTGKNIYFYRDGKFESAHTVKDLRIPSPHVLCFESRINRIEYALRGVNRGALLSYPLADLPNHQDNNDEGEIADVKVAVIIFNPYIESHSGDLISLYGWNEPDELISQYMDDMNEITGGYVNYIVQSKDEYDFFPLKNDGFQYTDSTYLDCMQERDNCHDADIMDYNWVIETYDLCERNVDEIWLFGGPYFGFYEACMTGPDAWWTNGPVIDDTSCTEPLHIMGYNYERSVTEMLHDMGHRVEGTMRNFQPALWQDFDGNYYRYNYGACDDMPPVQPEANCGNCHFPPTAKCHYEYNTGSAQVESDCDDWYNYPDLTGDKKTIDCTEWGCNQYGYMKWWLGHIPTKPGQTHGIYNNWWKYIV